MRDESHLEDMRAAIRGDFERLAQRRGSQELMQESPHPAEKPAEPEAEIPRDTVSPGAVSLTRLEPEAETAAGVVAEHDAETEPDPEPPPKGFFARLFGRSL